MTDAPTRGGHANVDDPVTYEVLRNRLEAITEEMRIALQQVSGSTTVTEASDFFTGLFLDDGRFATMGYQVAMGGPTVTQQIQHVIDDDSTDVNPGDMFIGNDPYVGALHQNDVQMAAPIFHDGELVAWAGVMAHETDVGGMDFASWSPRAEEIYQEGLRIPCVKLVEDGSVRHDVLDMILGASRLPDELGLDIRAFIATLNVARDRVGELIDRYGEPTVTGTMGRLIEDSARETRERLAELPDGTVRASDFLEHDGHENRLYKVDVVMEKAGDSIRLDFSGSSEQAPGFINTTRAGLLGGVAGGVLPTLGFDIRWNQGMLHPVDIEAPDGLICTAQHPAPVGAATVETCWVIINAVTAGLNKLLGCSDRYRNRARAGSAGAMATFNLGGVNQFGEPFGFHLLDPIAAGVGATPDGDGIHAGGMLAMPKPRIADVERNEQRAPIRYLHRRLATDTAGAGASRGGLGAEMALHAHEAEAAEALVMTHGLEVPNSNGLFGGHPGATVRQRLGRGALAANGGFSPEPLPEDPAELGGEWTELGPKPGRFPLEHQDVFAVSWQGGGGYGDPINRDPEAVAADVRRDVITERTAEEVYGVVVTGDVTVDVSATTERRQTIREARIDGPVEESQPPTDPVTHLGSALQIVRTEDGIAVKSAAGATLCKGSTRWREGAIASRLDPSDVPGLHHLHDDLRLTAFYCPASGDQLAVDVHEAGADPVDDVRLDVAGLTDGAA